MLEILKNIKNIHYYRFILYNTLLSCRMFWNLAELFPIDRDIYFMHVGYFNSLIKLFSYSVLLFH